MASYKLVFRVHAIQRMFQRGVDNEQVRQVLENGEVIENYPEDSPYPSRLVLGWAGRRPLHVVAADNDESRETIVITVYEPSPGEWKKDFKRRNL